ncbi:hypothetical protein Sango_2954800 [Sesamum angolense]|uniref:Retrotransposon gag domain-containing protein n=1 Tax=Sesamum angolense TaxID=2727404 RepID=A0AAE1T4X0_9LAMI|nr:hypothetical protein Sango_2954800 [Sesamum angolense]
MIQLTLEALRQMIEDSSAQAASRAIAQYVAQHAIPQRPPRHPHKDHGVDLALGNKSKGRRSQAAARQATIKGTEKDEGPSRSFGPIPSKADLLDISNAAYCKIFRMTLAGKAMTWFNQLPNGTIDNFEQLSQRFLHHFTINKRYPKTASYLFTVIQREHESLRDYVQRFSEAVLEVPHVNPELVANIMQQNLRMGRFRESIVGKPPTTLDELLVRAEKYIRIEETSGIRTATPPKRRAEEEDHSKHHTSESNQRDRRRLPPSDITRYTPLNAPRAEILVVAEQQGIVQWLLHMRKNPKRMKSNKYCLFHKDRGHSTEDCFHLKDEIEKLIQQEYLKEYVELNNPPREGSLRPL